MKDYTLSSYRRFATEAQWYPMSDSAFWRDLAEQFEKLDSESRLRVEWTYYSPPLNVYRFGVVGDTDGFESNFDFLTVRAGQRIDPSDPKDAWLTLVKRTSPSDTSRPGTVKEEGTAETPCIRGVTERPCRVSAALCNTFAAQGVVTEGQFMQPFVNEPLTLPKKIKRLAHSNPESILDGKDRVTFQTAAELLGVSVRRVREVVREGHLDTLGAGHAKQVSASSIRRRLNLSTNSEESGNSRK